MNPHGRKSPISISQESANPALIFFRIGRQRHEMRDLGYKPEFPMRARLNRLLDMSYIFGRHERIGIVTARVDATELDEARIKPIGAVLDDEPLLDGELLATLRWASRYYQHPLGEVLFAAIPTWPSTVK